MIEQRLMNLDEFHWLFDTHMGNHFPADELKPFAIMEQSVREGNYFPYGYYENGELLAYTCLLKSGDFFLLDYFAVMEEGRGRGTGSEILSVFTDSLKESESIFLEVEEPRAADAVERDLQERRIRFYLRNGALDTAVRAKVFSVPFRILTMGGSLREEEAERAMEALYHNILSEKMYEQNIFFRIETAEEGKPGETAAAQPDAGERKTGETAAMEPDAGEGKTGETAAMEQDAGKEKV